MGTCVVLCAVLQPLVMLDGEMLQHGPLNLREVRTQPSESTQDVAEDVPVEASPDIPGSTTSRPPGGDGIKSGEATSIPVSGDRTANDGPESESHDCLSDDDSPPPPKRRRITMGSSRDSLNARFASTKSLRQERHGEKPTAKPSANSHEASNNIISRKRWRLCLKMTHQHRKRAIFSRKRWFLCLMTQRQMMKHQISPCLCQLVALKGPTGWTV
ncbi:hypothetical protein B0T24DRAFT_598167 [Lasiosphaeria ovina]|uniref:Uncharacterized protein n=1 Tax=Lasiosphaeria ovina TaxID=92902 RepID=A0AAE0JVI4_9PEZI|nr:hypothetical protein B0T24DRAFT_598167 [Lasiosphaeria ovina]